MALTGVVPSGLNVARWARGDLVSHYTTRDIRPPEATLLLRYGQDLSGRVLELGCGGGRLTRYLVELSDAVHGIDIADSMVDHCRQAFPDATFDRMDLRDVGTFGEGSFDAVAGFYNVLDVLDLDERAHVLGEIHRVLAPGGSLLISVHNLASVPRMRPPTHVLARDPVRMASNVVRMPLRVRNHRRLGALEHHATDWAMLNDEAHDFSLLHFYAGPEQVRRQLAETGFAVEAVLDEDGRDLLPGEDAPKSGSLHYYARRA